MKRNWDLIRKLLLVIENAGSTSDASHETNGLDVTEHQVQYHLRLLVEAGFIRGVGQTLDGAISVRLTWDGHELLEISRDPLRWERAKQIVWQRTGSLSVIALRSVLSRWATASVAEAEPWKLGTAARDRLYRHRPPQVTLPASRPRIPSQRPPSARPTNLASPQTSQALQSRSAEIGSESHFQFDVWSGQYQETLPLYLL